MDYTPTLATLGTRTVKIQRVINKKDKYGAASVQIRVTEEASPQPFLNEEEIAWLDAELHPIWEEVTDPKKTGAPRTATHRTLCHGHRFYKGLPEEQDRAVGMTADQRALAAEQLRAALNKEIQDEIKADDAKKTAKELEAEETKMADEAAHAEAVAAKVEADQEEAKRIARNKAAQEYRAKKKAEKK